MKESEKVEVESFFLEMEGGTAKTLAECIVELAQFGSPTERNQKEFYALRSRRKQGWRKPGIISLMAPFMRDNGVSIPEIIRVVASSSDSSNRVHSNAFRIAPICVKFLRGEIKMRDKMPVVAAGEVPPRSETRSSAPPHAQQETTAISAAGAA